jgi:putative transposase
LILAGHSAVFLNSAANIPASKKGVHDSFCAANETGTLRTNGKRIKPPVIGWVRTREVVRFDGALKRATIGREADRWFVSLTIEALDVAVPLPLDEVVGVDLGVSTLATRGAARW